MSDFDSPEEPEGEGSGVEDVWYVPPELEEGTYGENVAIWISPYGFVLDFGTYQLPQAADPGDSDSDFFTPIRVNARVRIPAGLAFDMIRTISDKMAEYEKIFGAINAPEVQEQEDSNGDDY